jgi:hypothetical protein
MALPRPDDVAPPSPRPPSPRLPPPRLMRWIAPALLLLIAAGLSPLWWAATAPPHLPVIAMQRDAGGTLLVPTSALRPPSPHARLEAAGLAAVFVVRDGRAHLTPIRLGKLHPTTAEVHDGLDGAARIVANPPRGLEDRHRIAGP